MIEGCIPCGVRPSSVLFSSGIVMNEIGDWCAARRCICVKCAPKQWQSAVFHGNAPPKRACARVQTSTPSETADSYHPACFECKTRAQALDECRGARS